MTPHHTVKRRRLDPYVKSAQQATRTDEEIKTAIAKRQFTSVRKFEIDSDSDEESQAHRKKRGLKILSVKVRELVEKLGSTTYSNVANELIEQLRTDKARAQILGLDFGDESIDESDDQSPDRKGGSKKDSSNEVDSKGIAKWEKNVKRRVYDALNVLYAAGVLRKEGKLVSCEPKGQEGSRFHEVATFH